MIRNSVRRPIQAMGKVPAQSPAQSPTTKIAISALLALVVAGAMDPAEASRRRKQQVAAVPEPVVQGALVGPAVMAIGSIKGQRISLYDAEGNSVRAKISSGRVGYDTPVGIFSILQKNKEHYSNLYDDAAMPFMQRITWSGVSLHEGQLPGYPASHGCVRLPHSYAEQIFPLTKIGMRVILSRDDVAPAPITHAALLQPVPVETREILTNASYSDEPMSQPGRSVFQPNLANWPARQAEMDELANAAADKIAEANDAKSEADSLKRVLDTKTAIHAKAVKAHQAAEKARKAADARAVEIDRKLAKTKKPSAMADWQKARNKAVATVADAQIKLNLAAARLQTVDAEQKAAKQAWEAADAVRATREAVAVAAQQKTFPVSIFVSRKTQRLYVRQGHEAVLDVPVAIADPEKPIGTHVMTAVDYANGGNELKWTAVTMTGRSVAGLQTSALPERKQRNDKAAEPLPTNPAVVRAALDRITIPKEIVERFAPMAWVGSSLIVSDEAAHKETAKATDFIVVMSGEPQGALKNRPKQPPATYLPYYSFNSGYTISYGPRGQTIYRMRPQKPSTFSWW